jgi:shikimate dehydrogenase
VQNLTKVALIGNGISKSLTPAMHLHEARAQGIPYQYDLIDTSTIQFENQSIHALMSYAREHGYSGLNITFPFKRAVLETLDDIDPIARDLNAVNTVSISSEGIHGLNTDYVGYLFALKRGYPGQTSDRVLLVGAGGAGCAVCLALIDYGIHDIVVYDHDSDAAQRVVAHISSIRPNARICIAETLDPPKMDIQGIVNATPMGMAKFPGAAVDLSCFQSVTWVSDIVYFPLETAFLAQARSCGLSTMNGSAMAVGQAIKSFEIFSKYPADPDRMFNSFGIIHKSQGT